MSDGFTPPLAARSTRVRRTVVPFDDRTGLLRMDRNEDVSGWDEHRLGDVLQRLTPVDFAAYHDADHIQARIARWLGLEAFNISVTAGSSEAVQLVFETYLDEGEVVVTLDPSYGLYEVFAAKCGGRMVGVPFDEGLEISVEAIVDAIRQHSPSLVVIANPNQPTGTVLRAECLRILAREALTQGAILLFDEAYCLFTPVTAIPLVEEFPNVVVCQTFSKAMGLAGLRLGYCVSDSSRIDEINRLRPLTQSNAVALAVAEYVLDNYDWAAERVAEIIEGREYLIARLREMGLETYNSHANFALIGCPSEQDAETLVCQLRRRGYAVRGPLRGYLLDNFVRVTVARLDIMRRFVSENEDLLLLHARASQ